MSSIVLLHHPFDRFLRRRFPLGPDTSVFMIKPILDLMGARGHNVQICADPAALPKGDMLILHVDVTRVPQAYLDAAASFDVTVNGTVADISKSKLSQIRVDQNSAWDGPVIVKSDLNCGGAPEANINRRARRRWKAPPFPEPFVFKSYPIYDHITHVPTDTWMNPNLVVEKFVPEIHPDGFGLRTYIFCGPSERCALHISEERIVKATRIVRFEPAPVPPALRALRERLGFDYGKFDFVMHETGPILLDANKTPAGVTGRGAVAQRIAAGNEVLADGLESLL